jgi:hypothetical protein
LLARTLPSLVNKDEAVTYSWEEKQTLLKKLPYRACNAGVTQNALASLLGYSSPYISQLFKKINDGNQNSKSVVSNLTDYDLKKIDDYLRTKEEQSLQS